jgi:hypothetical protein
MVELAAATERGELVMRVIVRPRAARVSRPS